MINFEYCTKRGGGLAMSEVLSKILYDYKFVYFTCSHDRDVHMGEQNHQQLKLSAGDQIRKVQLNSHFSAFQSGLIGLDFTVKQFKWK